MVQLGRPYIPFSDVTKIPILNLRVFLVLNTTTKIVIQFIYLPTYLKIGRYSRGPLIYPIIPAVQLAGQCGIE